MGNTSFYLVVSMPDGETKHFQLNTDRIGIGRGVSNQIAIDVNSISSRHCEISRGPDGLYFVRDLGSKNGTQLNGAPLSHTEYSPLADGDFLLLGQSVYGQFVVMENAAVPNAETQAQETIAQLTRKHQPKTEPTVTTERAAPAVHPRMAERNDEEIDRDYERMAVNPIAAAVAEAMRPFKGHD